MTASIRIADTDMGAVNKVPLTGVGTIYGVTFNIAGDELPEYKVGIVDLLQPNMGVPKFEDFVYDNLEDADTKVKEAFVKEFTEFAKNRRNAIILS